MVKVPDNVVYRINGTHFPLCFVYQLSFECLLSARHLEYQGLFYPWSSVNTSKDWPRGLLRIIKSVWHCLSPFTLKKRNKNQVGICYNWKVKGTVMPATSWTFVCDFCTQKKHLSRTSSWITLFLTILELSSTCMCIFHWL